MYQANSCMGTSDNTPIWLTGGWPWPCTLLPSVVGEWFLLQPGAATASPSHHHRCRRVLQKSELKDPRFSYEIERAREREREREKHGLL